MPIDVQNERLLTLTEACKAIPSRPHRGTIERWRTRGCYGAVLETVLLGGRRFTSAEALERFFAATTAAADGRPAKAAATTAGEGRRERIAEAEARLRAAGI